MPNPSSIRDTDWRMSGKERSPQASRALAAFLLLVVVSTMGLIVWKLWPIEEKRAFMIAFAVSDYGQHTLQWPDYISNDFPRVDSPIHFAADSFEQIKSFENINLSDIEAEFNAAKPDSSRNVDQTDVAVVYLAGLGLAESGTPYLLNNNFDFDTAGSESGQTKLASVFRKIDKLPMTTKVVLLDVCRMPPDPYLGVVLDEFPWLLAEEVKKMPNSNFWVVASSGNHQVARTSFRLRRSVFSCAVERALRPVPTVNADDPLREVTIDAFFNDIRRTCRRLTASADGTYLQSPMLLRGTIGTVDLSDPAQATAAAFVFAQRKVVDESETDESGKTDAQSDANPPSLDATNAAGASAGANGPPDNSDTDRPAQPETNDGTSPMSSESSDDARELPPPYGRLVRIWRAVDKLRDRDTVRPDTSAGITPADLSTELWRKLIWDLTFWEHLALTDTARLTNDKSNSDTGERSGSLNRNEDELDKIETKLKALEMALATSQTDRLDDEWRSAWEAYQNAANRWPARIRNHPEYREAQSQKRYLADLLNQSAGYVRWYHRESMRSPAAIEDEFVTIKRLLTGLSEICSQIRLSGDVNTDADDAWWSSPFMEQARETEKDLQSQLVERLVNSIDALNGGSPLALVDADRVLDFLKLTVLTADEREKVYAALADYRRARLTPAELDSLIDDRTETHSPDRGDVWRAAMKRADLCTLLIEMHRNTGDDARSVLDAIKRNPRPNESNSGAVRDGFRTFGNKVRGHFESLRIRPTPDSAGRLDNSQILDHYLRDAHDVRTGSGGFVPLPGPKLGDRSFTPKLDLEPAEAPPRLRDIDKSVEWPIALTALGSIKSVRGAFLFDDQAIVISHDEVGELEPGQEFRIDVTSSGRLKIPARIAGRIANVSRQHEEVELVVTAGRTTRRRSFAVSMPGPTGVRLVVDQHVHNGFDIAWRQTEASSGSPDVVVLRPFPNRDSAFRFTLESLSDEPKSFEIEAYSLPTATGNNRRRRGKVIGPNGVFSYLGEDYARTGKWKTTLPIAVSMPVMCEGGAARTPIEWKVASDEPSAEIDGSTNANSTSNLAPAAPHDISYGLLFVVHELDGDKSRLVDPEFRWAEVRTRRPTDYLAALEKAVYNENQRELKLTIGRIEGDNLSFPLDISKEKPVEIRATKSGLSGELSILTSAGQPIESVDDSAVVIYRTAENPDWPVRVLLDVDAWPRALVYDISIDELGEQGTAGVEKASAGEGVRIMSINERLPDEKGGGAKASPLKPEFIEWFERGKLLEVALNVDAPNHAFGVNAFLHKVELFLNNRDVPKVTVFDDREHRITLKEVSKESLLLNTVSRDHVIAIDHRDYLEGINRLSAHYSWAGESQKEGGTASFGIDGKKPVFVSFDPARGSYGEFYVGNRITLRLVTDDDGDLGSGVTTVMVGWDKNKNGDLDEGEVDDNWSAEPISQDRNEWQLILKKAPTAGIYLPVVKITDGVGLERHIATRQPDKNERFEIRVKDRTGPADVKKKRTPKKTKTQKKESLFIHIKLVYDSGRKVASSDSSGWNIRLVGGGGAKKGQSGSLVVFSSVPDGEYEITVEGKLSGTAKHGQVTGVKPLPLNKSKKNPVVVIIENGNLKKE